MVLPAHDHRTEQDRSSLFASIRIPPKVVGVLVPFLIGGAGSLAVARASAPDPEKEPPIVAAANDLSERLRELDHAREKSSTDIAVIGQKIDAVNQRLDAMMRDLSEVRESVKELERRERRRER